MTQKPSIGAVYVTNGTVAVDRMLHLSQESFRRFHPELPIHVAQLSHPTDFPDRMRWYLGGRGEKLLRQIGGRIYSPWTLRSFARVVEEKMWAMINAPFDINILLDADTMLMRPFDTEIDLMLKGYDVVSYAEMLPMNARNCELLEWNIAKEVNLGAFLYNQRFVASYKKTLDTCTVPFEQIYNIDQALASLCLDKDPDLRIAWSDDLQLINHPETIKAVGLSTLSAMCREVISTRLSGTVFHYIYKKRMTYNALTKEIKKSEG